MIRSNWKDIPQWIERKKNPPDKFEVIYCTTGEKMKKPYLQQPQFLGNLMKEKEDGNRDGRN
jgi:hypothetical protein